MFGYHPNGRIYTRRQSSRRRRSTNRLLLGLKGAGIGGGLAVALFALATLFGRLEGATPEEAQLRSLFGGVSVGLNGYVGAAVTMLALAVIIAVTARVTVRRTLRDLD